MYVNFALLFGVWNIFLPYTFLFVSGFRYLNSKYSINFMYNLSYQYTTNRPIYSNKSTS